MRIKLQEKVDDLNQALGVSLEPYGENKAGTSMHSNIGHLRLDFGTDTVMLERFKDKANHVEDVFEIGHVNMKVMSSLLVGMLMGIELKGRRVKR